MDEPLKAWESYYVIVGSSAGALTGLQFVVLTLIAEGGRVRGSTQTLAAFASPNVVHFCSALFVSALLSAPWGNLTAPGIAVGLFGLGGLAYSVAVLRRAMRQKDYKPVLEDWIWHAALPILAYAAMAHSSLALAHESVDTLFVVAAAVLLLVFIGIHNAWDTVTYVMAQRIRESTAAAPTPSPAATPPPAPLGPPS